MVSALGSGQLRAAVIDVVVAEPLAEDSPSGTCRTSTSPPTAPPPRTDSLPNLYALFRENVRRYIDGSPLINETDTEIGATI